MPKVLLTGGSGFIAAHVLDVLLKRGYEVVTTVRSEAKASQIRAKYPGAKLTVSIVADIAAPAAFDEVIRSTPGLDYVQHTASPFHFNFTDPKTEILDPAINGTNSVFQAIKDHAPGVKRVVLTSSFAAILTAADIANPDRVFTEADWNPNTYEDGLNGPHSTTYRVSKTCAEKAGWDFIEREKPGFDLATICPPLVFGPVAHHLASQKDINTSNQRFVDVIQGKWKTEIPATGVHLWVDVRDVATAHVEAMERPEAGGQRFFTTAGFFDNARVAAAVRAAGFPELADKLPGDDAKLAEGATYRPGSTHGYDNSRTTKALGIDWISIEQSAVDTVKSLLPIPA
ncbi:hypothetical protein M426DRAFT_321156 [Hypoxylon sp. CI-4A]|nr:hypothetical protein M426DRAFT_321156 [Hypoxylon sp. CI-4A]